MTSTLNFETQQPPSKLMPKGHCWCDTSINKTVKDLDIPSMMPNKFRQHYAPIGTKIYLHTAAPTEPTGDGSINTTDFTGQSPTTYTATSDGTYAKSFTTETSFFSSNQDFDDHNTEWEITYRAWYTGTPAKGREVHLHMEFYKRNSSNVDTLLFTFETTISSISNEFTKTVIPSGSVTTSDRLRIRVKATEEIPA